MEEASELDFFKHLRLTRASFAEVLDFIQQAYGENPSRSSLFLGPKQALYLTLWYLGTQSTHREISQMFGVAESTVFECVQRVIDVLCNASQQVIRWPSLREIVEIEREFELIGGFPGVVGALDGSHVSVKAPAETQGDYADRTLRHSVILMAVCTPDKKFSFVQAGCPGAAHDSRAFKLTSLYSEMQRNNRSYFPSPDHHILGDSAFALHRHLMVPFKNIGNLSADHKRYNVALSKTRVVIENAFGFLKGRFRRLLHIDADMERIPKIIIAACVLHNIALSNVDDVHHLEREGVSERQDVGEEEEQHLAEPHIAQPQEAIRKRASIVRMLSV